jgi:hypothetical protein
MLRLGTATANNATDHVTVLPEAHVQRRGPAQPSGSAGGQGAGTHDVVDPISILG